MTEKKEKEVSNQSKPRKGKINDKIDRKALKIFILIISITSLLLFTLISQRLRASIIISLFIIISMIISSYKKYIHLPVEIEILTLGIVLCTIEFGLKAGLIVAILGGILSFVVGWNINPFSIPMLFGYILMAIVSFILPIQNITYIGILASLANNSLVFGIYHFLYGYDLTKNLSFSISNLILNVVVFYNIAPFLSQIIS